MKKKPVRTACAAAILVLMFASMAAFAAEGDYGALAVEEDQVYTLEQMLTYAMQDEYLARARYLADMDKFGQVKPFPNIAESEKTHIILLNALFEKYGIPLPEDKSGAYITVPDTQLEAMKAGAEGEKNNIRMYDIFLKQKLPDDAMAVFSVLKRVSGSHLAAFKKGLGKLEHGFPRKNNAV